MTRFGFWQRWLLCVVVLCATSAAAWAQRGAAGPQAATTVPAPKFYYMGPETGSRVSAVVGVPGDKSVYYVGASSGGLWKSTDGGKSFVSIFDNTDVAAVGTLAIAPSDPNTLWVGTGEPWIIRNYDMIGDGVYVTHDAGKTFEHVGLEDTGRIARILVSPTDPNTAWVCAEGRLTGPQHDRGVFKTTDGGKNWKQTLFVDENTGCSGLSLDPHDPNTMLAGAWQVSERTWALLSGGPGSGVYISHDGGDTFTKITEAQGMPHPDLGKIDVAIAPSDGRRMYALIQTADQGSVWRSDDGGANWKVASWDRALIGRAGYYLRIAVNPFNEDDVLITNSGFERSHDGALHFSGGGGGRGAAAGGAPSASCGDCHDIWMDPKIENRFALTGDSGASLASGTDVTSVSLPIGQMYHIAADNRVPYFIYSNRQDNGSHRGPSTQSLGVGSARVPADTFMPEGGAAAGGGRGGRAGRGRGAALPEPAEANGLVQAPPYAEAAGGRGGRGGQSLAWQSGVGGCESGWTVPDPVDSDIVWASCLANKMTVYNEREGTARSISPWFSTMESSPTDTKYRCHWTPPVAVDPFDHNIAYYGCQLIFKTSNGGQTWTEFSPDLSTKDPARIVSNGGIEGDNLGQFDGEVVWDIAPSPIQAGLIWAGTNDGKVWYTKDRTGGKTWVDVTKNLPFPTWGQINAISPSSFDAATAYVAVDFHLGRDDYKPYIYKTTDFGATWKNVTGNLPSSSPMDYVMCVAENPNRKGMLFASTAHAFFYSLDDGTSWVKLTNGLPPSPVSWINVEKRFHDVDVSTYGRGLYILPDITVLEQTGKLTPDPSVTKLYAPTDIFRKARGVFPTEAQITRPQFILNLATAPAAPLQIEILDSTGTVVRHEQVQAHAGVNGLYWDLRTDPAKTVALRTTPPENPHIWDELRYQNTKIRAVEHWGISAGTGLPMEAPGSYVLRLTVDGQTLTQPFTVKKDPAVITSDADLQASSALQLKYRNDTTEAANLVNQMEIWRKQIEDQRKANAGNAGVVAALDTLNNRILKTEHQLVTPADMLSDDKHFPMAFKVYTNLVWESAKVSEGAGDEAGGMDYRPTDADYKVFATLDSQLAAAKADFDTLPAVIQAFNQSQAGKVLAIGNALPNE